MVYYSEETSYITSISNQKLLKKPSGEINNFNNLRFTRGASCSEVAAIFRAYEYSSHWPTQDHGYDCPLFSPPLPGGTGWLAREADNLTAICEPTV
jgi:hypothetical protein